ncbi:hypothetical protein CHS0354_015012 [Potamilus streckersoni]|uniref:Tetraspanin n=1 Tax=Potamilus streckersoni TaxID=2493646 RepID=A0AAE0SMF0_9BIVA|nr:hypothetical protein CHS0354_015012 [Potamilus streckersoni]
MSLGSGGKCVTSLLVLINTLFLFLGIALHLMGIVMHGKPGDLMNQVNINGVTMSTLVSFLSLFSICLGCFIIVVAIMGAFGACCNVKCMLIVYAIIILFLLLAEIAIVALWAAMRNKVESLVTSEMKNAFKGYNGPSASDQETVGWNLLFIGMDCCGVVGPSNDLDEFASTNWTNSRSSDKIPYSCCKSSKSNNYTSGSDTNCTQSFQNYRSNGCYKAIYSCFNEYSTAAIVIVALILAIEFIGMVLAFVLCCDIGKEGRLT